MRPPRDSFGPFGAEPPETFERAARRLDRVVSWVLVASLALVGALAGYALWDQAEVLSGPDLTAYEPGKGFGDLMALNPDVCAWLTVDGTQIGYPVVQGDDNFAYLERDATGEFSASGSVFLDAGCDRGFGEPYELLYGHHMQGGRMFGDLDRLLDAAFFDAHPSATLYLPHETLALEVDAVIETDAYDGTFFSLPADGSRVVEVERALRERATRLRAGSLGTGSPVAVGSDALGPDQLVALSTCADAGTDERTVVVCRVVGREASENQAVGTE